MFTINTFRKRKLLLKRGGIIKARGGYPLNYDSVREDQLKKLYPNLADLTESLIQELNVNYDNVYDWWHSKYEKDPYYDPLYDINPNKFNFSTEYPAYLEYLKSQQKESTTEETKSGLFPLNSELINNIINSVKEHIANQSKSETITSDDFDSEYWRKRANKFGFNNKEEVKEWQRKAQKSKWYTGTPDGKFGPRSEMAWNHYNKENDTFDEYTPSKSKLVSKSKGTKVASLETKTPKYGDTKIIDGITKIYTKYGWKNNHNGRLVYKNNKIYDIELKDYVDINPKTNTWSPISIPSTPSNTTKLDSPPALQFDWDPKEEEVEVLSLDNKPTDYLNGTLKTTTIKIIPEKYPKGPNNYSKILPIKADGSNVKHVSGFFNAPSSTDKRWKITSDGYKRIIDGNTIWVFKGGYYWKSTDRGKTYQSTKRYKK